MSDYNNQDYSNQAQDLAKERASRAGRKTVDKIGSTTKKYVKKGTSKIANKLVALIGGPMGCGGLALMLIIVIIVVMICIILRPALYPATQAYPTPEGKCILNMFNSYAEGTYDEYAEKTQNLNEDSERDKYRNYYNQIISQPYHQYVLCGVWKTVVYEYLCNDYVRTDRDNGTLNTDGNIKGVKDYYDDYTQFYWENLDTTLSEYIAFRSCGVKKDEYVGRHIHWKYTNNLFKVCLSSFFDDDDNLIIADDDVRVTEPDTSSTQSTEATDENDVQTQREAIDKEIENLTKKIFKNLKSNMNSCVLYYQNNGDDLTLKICVEEYMAYTMLDSDSSLTMDDVTKKFDKEKSKLYDNMLNKIIVSSSSFYTLKGTSGNAAAMIQLARQQLGNTGHKYAKESKCWGQDLGDTPWCCIYIGWLMEQSGCYPSEVGWSASVPTWKSNADKKGIYQSASNYSPVAGDVFIEGNCKHVGLILEVYTDGTVLTSEGNASGDPNSSSKVCEYKRSLSDFTGYIIINNVSALLKSEKIDSNYLSKPYILSDTEREEIEKIVSGEFGNDYEGAVLIAQCIRDALTYGYADSPMTVRKQMRYDGYSSEITDNAKQAVRYVFDDGGMGVQHRILVMYATYITSEWHETQNFIVEIPCNGYSVRFFDYW